MKTTAKVGSEPTLLEMLLMPLMNERGEIGDDVSAPPPDDKGDNKSDSPSDKGDDKSDPPADDKVPWDKDPRWQEWRGAEQKLQTILKNNEVESIEDLEELLKDGTELKGRIKDVGDIEDLIKKAATLDKYETYWQEQEKAKQYEDETESERIARLESELKSEKGKTLAKEREIEAQEENQKAVVNYEREVKSLLREVDKDQQSFLAEFFGVGNPLYSLDITDTKAVNKMVEEGLKKKEAYDQAVIKNYIDGKTTLPKIPSGDTATPKVEEVKTLKEARTILKERMAKFGQ